MKELLLLAGIMLFGVAASGQTEAAEQVVLETNHGRIVIELDEAAAPVTTASFLENVDAGTYDGSIFHRVIPDFMVQGGGFSPELQLIPTDKSLLNEADNGLKNLRGTVAMARRGDPHSASIQFFINLVDNGFLDHTEKTPQGWGYAVFGRIVEGMEVADAIAEVPRGQRGPMGDVPVEAVVIESAKRASAEEPAETAD
ncbi:MAG: peptidylprolyl isomerase [Thermoanaerobaculia bacterium]